MNICNDVFVSELKRIYKDYSFKTFLERLNDINYNDLNLYCKVYLNSFIDYISNKYQFEKPSYYEKNLKMNSFTFPEGIIFFTKITNMKTLEEKYKNHCIKEFKERNLAEITIEDVV